VTRADRGITDGASKGVPPQNRVEPGRSDSVDIGIAKYISQELNAADMERTRRERVEELKKLVQSGEYRPDSSQVAQAVGEEIVMEILSAGGARSKE
jgi:anti-sigma28 factor (negative regulator of flagellin synthesis)